MKNDSLEKIKKEMTIDAHAYNKHLTKNYLGGKNLFNFVHPLDKDYFKKRFNKLFPDNKLSELNPTIYLS